MNVETHKLNQSKTSAWLKAMRLRTLPLALASTITGVSLAAYFGAENWLVAMLTGLTTVLLQVNSNLANDYGDFLRGTDSDDRLGPVRALQSGVLNSAEMKRAIVLFSILSFLSGCFLLYLAPVGIMAKGVLLFAGVMAIYASIKYTAGSNPYGYRGLGDISVMVFFGILGVLGAFYIQTNTMPWSMILPAIGLGAFSAGVLNINNTRDRVSDIKAGKITLAVKLGAENARRYQVLLMAVGVLCFVGYAILNFKEWNDWIFSISLPLFSLIGYKVYSIQEDAKLDPFLKLLALSTFLLSALVAIGVWL